MFCLYCLRRVLWCYVYFLGLPRWPSVKNPFAKAGDVGFVPWVGRIPWRSEWLATPVFLPGEFHGRRSLAGFSPWGCKELDTTEHLSMHTHLIFKSVSHFEFIFVYGMRVCSNFTDLYELSNFPNTTC